MIVTFSDVSIVLVTLCVAEIKYKPFSVTENFWFKISLALLLKINEILPLSLLLSVVKLPYFVNKFSRLLILYNIFINLLEGYYEFSSIRKF